MVSKSSCYSVCPLPSRLTRAFLPTRFSVHSLTQVAEKRNSGLGRYVMETRGLGQWAESNKELRGNIRGYTYSYYT